MFSENDDSSGLNGTMRDGRGSAHETTAGVWWESGENLMSSRSTTKNEDPQMICANTNDSIVLQIFTLKAHSQTNKGNKLTENQ